MRKIKNILVIVVFASLLSCKGTPKVEPSILEYDNIMIYTDLSSRMVKSPSDTLVINQVIDFFVKDCVKPGIKVNDRSSISFSRINYQRSNCPTAKIDISQIENLEEKQQFVNDQSEDNSLSKAILEFKNNVRCNYRERDNGGLDIFSILFQEVNSGNHLKETDYLINKTDTTIIYFHNHLILFTDGYLEYSTKTGSSDFYFGERQLEALRKFCREEKISPEKAIRNNPEFKIRPLYSENNKFVKLYILETDDRGFNIKKGTYKNTGDLSDNNLLHLVWKVWAEESGFSHFVWKQKTTASNLPSDYVKKIIIR